MNLQLRTIRTYVMMARATKQKWYLDLAKKLLAEYKVDRTITVIYQEIDETKVFQDETEIVKAA